MARKAAGLTARGVATKPKGLWADGGGLYLQVSATGARSWIFRYQLAGRRRDMGLGRVDVFSLAEAREKAAKARRLVAEGLDPIEHRKREAQEAALAQAKAVTFRECAESYIAAMRPGWKNAKHAAQWQSTLVTYAYPVLGDLPVAAIDTGLVVTVLQPLWQAKPETASRLRGRIEAILDNATARRLRDGPNPAQWKGNLAHVLPKKGDVATVQHHRAMRYADLPAWWPRLQAHDGLGARALELAILTFLRHDAAVLERCALHEQRR
jgi:hypothetical protein